MHLITQKALKDAAEKYPQHKTELVALGNTIAKGYFKKPESLKAVFPSLDNFKYLDSIMFSNVGGNELRVCSNGLF
ncbi:translation-dependent mRNA interferase, toxin of the HigB-HigA toxin-antitoxin system [Escherichia coli]|uniref:Translation-dependent mRNA interferase, toxin of the HigB-HigA toxin-antitoxin system n=1 Tax=Escherichia coli TaxID=562 RepID=A0A377DA51_ECOLX|nr:translation-dependent mRNA interferase, toxin of the HigB-HigA toxin-antitoxin system [Escherichia coli]